LGGVVLAQSGSTTTTTTTTNPEQTLLAKVAAILGIDQTKLEAAFTKAEKEIQTDALTNRLQALVEAGKLTQAQADQYLQWWQSRPTLPEDLNLPRLQGRMGFGGLLGMNGCFPQVVTTVPSTTTR
jgi:multidrug efflux pump subunit AcrA (membrane-fusion protein)